MSGILHTMGGIRAVRSWTTLHSSSATPPPLWHRRSITRSRH